jgi:hypothetical protein
MATYTKYQIFVQDLGRKVHNLNADTLKIALTNTAPNVATNAVLADIAEIAAGNGYGAGGATITVTSYSQTSGTAKLNATTDVVFTASGAGIATFRYAVLYNSTAAGGPLIAYWDSGAGQNITAGNTFTVDLDQVNGILQIV